MDAALDAYQKTQKTCEAYTQFKLLLENIRSKYECLDFSANDRCEDLMTSTGLTESGMEFIRGGIVAMIAAWENYVHDLFDEAFDAVITICSGPDKNLKRLREQWPACADIIEKEMKNLMKTPQETYKLLEKTDLEPKQFWMELLDTHRRDVLNQRTLQPIFDYRNTESKTMTIDKLFMQLFETKEKGISEIVVEVAQGKHFKVSPELQVSLVPGDTSAVEALHNISSLYYGLRCVFVHGKRDKTLKGGVLSNFPENESTFHLPDQEGRQDIVKKYMGMFRKICTYERKDIHVSHANFTTIHNFIRFVAIHLMKALAKWIYDLQREKHPVWGYTPY